MASDIEHQDPNQITNDGNASDHSGQPDPGHENPAVSPSCLSSLFSRIIFNASRLLRLAYAIAYIVIVSASYVLFPLAAMVFFAFFGRCIKDQSKARSSAPKGTMQDIYQQSRRTNTKLNIRIRMSSIKLLARAGLLVLVWLVLNVLVSRFKRLTLLGSPLWRWDLLALTITSGYFVATMMYMAVPLLQSFANIFTPPEQRKLSLGKFFFYLVGDTSTVVHMGIVLVAWLVYFRTDRGLNNASISYPQAFDYVTWTCVSLFVGSVLWLLKTFFLLKWSAKAIYHRFQPKILITEVKFLYIGVIIGSFLSKRPIRELMEVVDEIDHRWEPRNFHCTKYISSRKPDFTHTEQVGRYFMSLATNLRPLQEDGVSYLVDFFQQKIDGTDEKCELHHLLELLTFPDHPGLFAPEQQRNTAIVLYNIVREEYLSDDFTLSDLKKWMVDAHRNCVNMGRTLIDANEIVTHLEIVISVIIVLAVVLLWLLITGVATTTVLVAIAPPFLAFTFIFGDSAKTFFQGILFCFVTHPFDVGDRCVIQQIELEVKSIGILTTTFTDIGTIQKRMYPNSLLATIPIVNLGSHSDPTDVVEVTLDLSTALSDLQMLETKIQQFFSDPQQKGFFEKSHEVLMKNLGDKVTVTIHFKHVLNIKEVTHSQCLHKKNKQRSIFLKKLTHFLTHKSSAESANDNGGSTNDDNDNNNNGGSMHYEASPLVERARTWS